MPSVLEKQCRIGIRLTRLQCANYERAAALRGLSLTQWATSHLDMSARRDIGEAETTVLSPESSDVFCKMLDAPLPEAAERLLARKAVWE